MKIGIDIDDTMADTFDYLMPYIAEFFNIDIKYLKDNNISYSNLPKEMKERELEFAKKYYDKVIASTPFKPKVAEYIDKIKELGHEIIVITARNKTLYTDEYKTTIEELKNNNIHYDKLICDFDKAKVCKNENIDLFIDDSIANCNKVNKLGIKTILFNSKSNINDKINLYRIDSWKDIYKYIKEKRSLDMILYATKQTIKELNIPMPDELSTFNNIIANKVMEEQSGNELLEWVLKLFYFDGRKCLQAINFASKLAVFLFDIGNEEIGDIANTIVMYLNEIYSNDFNMKRILEKFYDEYPVCAFSRLVNKSIISSLNHNQFQYADDGYRFYEYIDKNILNTIKINKDFNWNYLTTKNIDGKKEYIYPAEYFRELFINRYGG